MFILEVFIFNEKEKRGKWIAVTPTHSLKPYAYKTKEEALRMLRICYSDEILFNDFSKARVKEVGKDG